MYTARALQSRNGSHPYKKKGKGQPWPSALAQLLLLLLPIHTFSHPLLLFSPLLSSPSLPRPPFLAAMSASAPAAAAAAAAAPTLAITTAPINRFELQLWQEPAPRQKGEACKLATIPLEQRPVSTGTFTFFGATNAGVLKQWLDERDQQADAPLPASGFVTQVREWLVANRYHEVSLSCAAVLRLVETADQKVLREWAFAYKTSHLQVDCAHNEWTLTSEDKTVVLSGGSLGRLKQPTGTTMPKGLRVQALCLLRPAWHAPELVRIRQLLAEDSIARAAIASEQRRDECKKRMRQAQEELDAAEQAVERCAKRIRPAAAAAAAAAI